MPYDQFERRNPGQIMADAAMEALASEDINLGPETVGHIIDTGLTAFFNSGGRVFDAHQVAAMRRSLEWVQRVIASTASTNADQRYLETLGLLGFIGEPEESVSLPARGQNEVHEH